jgi:7-cyano-7-deazaguanine synthase
LDSAALAAWLRPAGCLFVDYGQVPASAEQQAASRIASALGLEIASLTVNCSAIGSGLLAGRPSATAAPTSEWWPFRNQLLASLAAAWALGHGFTEVWFGVVDGDARRHADGSRWFFRAVDELTRRQEGGIAVRAPAIDLTTEDLVVRAGLPRGVLGITFSCHASNEGCGACPGCEKRRQVLDRLLA